MLYQLSYSREFEAGPAASGATGCHVPGAAQPTHQNPEAFRRPTGQTRHLARRPPVPCALQPSSRQRPVRRPSARSVSQPNSRRSPVRLYIDRRGASRARNEAVVLEDQIDVSHQGANAYDKPARPAQGTHQAARTRGATVTHTRPKTYSANAYDKPARPAQGTGKPVQTQGLTIFHTKQQTRFSGGCWIRTNVGNAGRFTACSLWPLGQPSEVQHRASGGTRTPNHLFTKQVLCQLSYASRKRTRIFASRGAARDSEQVSEASSVHGQDRQWPGGTSRAAPRAHQKKGAPHPYFPLSVWSQGEGGGGVDENRARSARSRECQA
jgi:hypothetical protein